MANRMMMSVAFFMVLKFLGKFTNNTNPAKNIFSKRLESALRKDFFCTFAAAFKKTYFYDKHNLP